MNIYEGISLVMSQIEPIAKGRTNSQGAGFKFRGIDDVMNELQPALVKAKIFIVPEVIESKREEKTTAKGGNLTYSILTIKFTFYAEDGTNVSATVIGEAFDSGDKASNKAMSIGFKYACLQVFCIPTEDTKDPDAESHDVTPKSKQAAPDKSELVSVKAAVIDWMQVSPAVYNPEWMKYADKMCMENNLEELKACIAQAVKISKQREEKQKEAKF